MKFTLGLFPSKEVLLSLIPNVFYLLNALAEELTPPVVVKSLVDKLKSFRPPNVGV
jgi:hypothetical protein